MPTRRVAPIVLSLAGLALPVAWLACVQTGPAPATSVPPSIGPGIAAVTAPAAADFHSQVEPFVKTYCVTCHGGKKPEAQLDLSAINSLSAVSPNLSRWSEVAERISLGEMPPDDADKLPSAAERKPVVAWLQAMRQYESQRRAGDPGTVFARRLSNAEYDYTIRDLTGVDLHPTREFPVDPANEAGFDNSGESLAMSPALVKKYLEAARAVADHAVFTPGGIRFAPFPVATEDDRDNYTVHRIVDFYRRQGVSLGLRQDALMAQSVEYADYFAAAWRFQHRAALGRSQATLADFAASAKLSPKYLATLHALLTRPTEELGPIAALQARWKSLPAPEAGHEPATLRAACEGMRDLIQQVRPVVRMKFNNLVPNSRIVATGSQPFVLWLDQQFAQNRLNYAGNALTADWSKVTATDPAMTVPTTDADKAKYEDAFKRFCAVFPDAFVVYERGRMFMGAGGGGDLAGHRYLSAGLHSQMAFFRDDRPLCELVLDDAQRRELDGLWQELEFVSVVPFRQFKQNVWFERGEPPSVMVNPIFNSFRSEDDNLLSEAMVKRLADTYYDYVSKIVLHVPANGGRGGRGGRGGQGRPPPPAAAAPANAADPVAANATDPIAANAAATPNVPATPNAPATPPPAAAVAVVPAAPAAAPVVAPAAAADAAAVVFDNTPLNFKAPAPGTVTGPPAPGMVEQRLSPEALQAIRDYFPAMNARIRALEKAQKAAEPVQLQSLVEFAERAARRPMSSAEKNDLVAFYRTQRKERQLSHEDALRECIVAVLMAPSFCYRADIGHAARSAPPGVQPLSDYELANRLSYFLWSSMPDAELLQHAAAGDLHRPEVMVAQARRMLRDPKVRGFATEFGGNWLDIRRFEEHNAVDRARFPTFTNELRAAMFEEPIRFIADVAQSNRSILDFVYGEHTFVNPVLAKHYGIPLPENAAADQWVRIDDARKYERGGLLPMAAFLTKNAPGLRTSPVKRGHWVVTKLLGERIPAPPPNVPTLPGDETKLGDLTLRQTLAKHREDKTCASCHNKFDSFGLVFEGFGPVGETRQVDLGGRPVQIGAQFPDGTEGAGVAGLQNYLHTKVEHEFVTNLCRKLLVYGLGRTLQPSDDLLLDEMRANLARDGYHFGILIDEIVTSRQFLNKRVAPEAVAGL
jgi:hypothetical protein